MLRLNPTLMTNADYLAPGPELTAFLAQHPEVAHNPAVLVGTREQQWERRSTGRRSPHVEEMMEGLI